MYVLLNYSNALKDPGSVMLHFGGFEKTTMAIGRPDNVVEDT